MSEKKPDLDKPRFIYLRGTSPVPGKLGPPVACIAYSKLPGELRFGMSCHNPRDKFDRTRARVIAEGRFEKRFRSLFVTEAAPLRDVLHDLMFQLSVGDFDAPIRVQQAATRYLEHLDSLPHREVVEGG